MTANAPLDEFRERVTLVVDYINDEVLDSDTLTEFGLLDALATYGFTIIPSVNVNEASDAIFSDLLKEMDE